MKRAILALDMFGGALPSFNSGGQQYIRTYTGGCCSLFIIILTMVFAGFKLEGLFSRNNATVNVYEEVDTLELTDSYKPIEDETFAMAVTISNANTYQVYDDARFVKWWAAQWDKTGKDLTLVNAVPLHPCTDADFAKFYPPDATSAPIVERYKRDGGLYCLDMEAMKDFILSGAQRYGNFRAIDIMAIPCHVKETTLGGTEDNVRDDCVTDKAKSIEYLNNLSIEVYYNQNRFQQSKYSQTDRVRKLSQIYKRLVDRTTPNLLVIEKELNQLSDTTDYLQLFGKPDQAKFDTFKFKDPIPSAIDEWPTDQAPDGIYKFTSATLFLSQNETVIERQTYSILDWLGDVGGLFDALYIIVKGLTFPMTAHLLNSKLAKRAFDSGIVLLSPGTEPKAAYCTWRDRKFRHLQARVSKTLENELDLMQFVYRRRRHKLATSALLNALQRQFIIKVAGSLSLSDDHSSDSSSAQHTALKNLTASQLATELKASRSSVNERLFKVFQRQQAKTSGQPKTADQSQQRIAPTRRLTYLESSIANHYRSQIQLSSQDQPQIAVQSVEFHASPYASKSNTLRRRSPDRQMRKKRIQIALPTTTRQVPAKQEILMQQLEDAFR